MTMMQLKFLQGFIKLGSARHLILSIRHVGGRFVLIIININYFGAYDRARITYSICLLFE